MNKKPRILITNDDGIQAKGLYHLWEAVHAHCELVICAPIREQSGVGLAITVRDPLRMERIEWPSGAEAWSVTGTPADCVKLGIHKALDRTPDLILSGINRGSNAGRNVLYSGTVAGVIEGAMRGIPGIAFSCLDYLNPDYSQAADFILAIVNCVLQRPLPQGTILNVNFPMTKHGRPKGVKLTRQGREYWVEDPSERQHPAEGHSYYWLGIKKAKYEEHDESDIAWLRQGYVTCVPLQVCDLTNHDLLKESKKCFDTLLS